LAKLRFTILGIGCTLLTTGKQTPQLPVLFEADHIIPEMENLPASNDEAGRCVNNIEVYSMFHLELLSIFSKEKSQSKSKIKPPSDGGGRNITALVLALAFSVPLVLVVYANFQRLRVKVQSLPVTFEMEVDKRVDRF
jgi:hypothetical protein